MAQMLDILEKPWIIFPQNNYAIRLAAGLSPMAAILNTILLYRFYIHRRNLSNGYLILISMCFGDFLSSICLGVSSILHTISFQLTWKWCQYVGMVLMTAASTSAASAFFMSLERYKQIVLSRTFSKNRIIQTIIFIWLFFPFMASIPLMTGAVYEERPSQVWCLPAFTGHATENLPFMIMAHILLWTALIGIPFCYWNIYKFALHNGFKWGLRKGAITAVVGPSASSNTGYDTRNSQTLKTAGMDLSSQSVIVEDYSKADNALRSQLRLTKKMALLVLQFYIGWFGLAISFMFETFQNTRISPAGDFILGTSNVLSWVLNPIILLTLDNQLKIRFTLRHKS